MIVAMPLLSLIGCILWNAFCWLDFVRPLHCSELNCSITSRHLRSLLTSYHAGHDKESDVLLLMRMIPLQWP